MIKASVSLQELRKKIYLKAKSDKTWNDMCFGWNRWSSAWLYNALSLYNDYKIRYYYA